MTPPLKSTDYSETSRSWRRRAITPTAMQLALLLRCADHITLGASATWHHTYLEFTVSSFCVRLIAASRQAMYSVLVMISEVPNHVEDEGTSANKK